MNRAEKKPVTVRICLMMALFPFIIGLVFSKTYAATNNKIEFAADHPPYLEDFVVSTSKRQILLSLKVANPFDHELKNLISNGVSQNITLNIKVKVNSFNLFLVKFNRTLSSNSYTHTITYDNLKKLFTVTAKDQGNPLQTPSYKEALRYASTFSNLGLLEEKQIEKDLSYQVETQAEIRKVRLPFHLEYFFFFLSAWDRKSNSYTIDIPTSLLNQIGSNQP